MKVQQAVWTETRKIAIGVFCFSMIMILAFVGLQRFDYTVVLGAVLGMLGAVGNFFFMALTVQRITEKIHGVRKTAAQAPIEPLEEDEEAPLTAEEEADLKAQTDWAKKRMRISQAIRMLVIVGIGVLALKVACFHPVAALVPFLFPRVVILVNSFIEKRKEV